MELGAVVAVASVLVGAANLGRLWYLRRISDRPGLGWFQGGIASQAVFCAAYGIGLLLGDLPLRPALLVAYWLAAIWIGVCYLGFALDYTGRARLHRARSLRSLPTVLRDRRGPGSREPSRRHVPLARPRGERHRTRLVRGRRLLEYVHSPFVFFEFLLVAALATVGVALLLDTVLSYGPLYRRHAFAIAITPIPPIAAYLVWLFEIPPV